jgi:hypothetical protein
MKDSLRRMKRGEKISCNKIRALLRAIGEVEEDRYGDFDPTCLSYQYAFAGLQKFNTTGLKQKALKDIVQGEKLLKAFHRRCLQRFGCLIRTFWRGTTGGGGCSAYGQCYEVDPERPS